MRCVLLCDPWPLLSYISHHVYVTKRQHYYPRVKIINHAVLSSGAAAYPHMTDTKHIVYYSHEDVKSRYSLILGIGLYNSWPSHPVDTTRVMYTLHNRRSPQCKLTMNRKIVTSHVYVGWNGSFTTKFWHRRRQWCTYWWQASHPLLPPFLHHCTAVVDMTVVTAKKRLRLIYLDTEQDLFRLVQWRKTFWCHCYS